MCKYIVGFLVGLLFASAVPAYGAVSSLVGKKVGSEIAVNLDSKEVGSAIVVDGRSYLPVRAAAEALDLGLEVTKEAINLVSTEPIMLENDNFDQIQSLTGSINELNSLKNNAIKKLDKAKAFLDEPNDKYRKSKELLDSMPENDPRRPKQEEVVATFEDAQKYNEQQLIDLQAEIDSYNQQIAYLEAQKTALESQQ